MSRTGWFVAIAALCVGGALVYLLQARSRSLPRGGPTLAQPANGAVLSDGALVFRVAAGSSDDGSLAVLADAGAGRENAAATALRCERVAAAAGRGVCLVAERGFLTTYHAELFDRAFRPSAKLPLPGAPSRVQVSPDGRWAGMTVFVSGHSYAMGGFSTRSSIADLERGEWRVEDLETFTVRRDGRTIEAPDFNFWGVTFARDGNTFYATLGTGGETLLVRGDLAARAFEVVADAVECPSLSPDETRVAYKHRERRAAGAVSWRLWVLDLASGARHPLAETRSVDDQAQWLDDAHVLYALPGEDGRSQDQWVVPADGSGAPRLLLRGAYSTVVHRER